MIYDRLPVFAFRLRFTFSVLFLFWFGVGSFAQTDSIPAPPDSLAINGTALADSLQGPLPIDDDTLSTFIKEIQSAGQREYQNSQKVFESRKVYLRQQKLISQLKEESFQIKSMLNKRLSFDVIKVKMAEFQRLIPIAIKGINPEENELLTERNLTVTKALLNEMIFELKVHQTQLKEYADAFRQAQYRIDSISSDKDLYTFSQDSLETRQYAFLLIENSKEIKPIGDSVLVAANKIDSLQTSLNEFIFDLNSQVESLELTQRMVNSSLLTNEIPQDKNKNFYKRELIDAIEFSVAKEKLVLLFYVKLYKERILIFILLNLFGWFFLNRIKKRTLRNQPLEVYNDQNIVIKNPIFSSIIICTGLFQFFFPNPPFIFYWVIWFVASLSITILFLGNLSRYWTIYWIFTVAMFLIAGLQNMILLPSVEERYLMGIIALIGFLFLVFTVRSEKNHQLKERRILYFIWLMGLMEGTSLLLNILGRFNLSKSFLVAGYIGVVVGILLLWTFRLINQSLSLASKLYHNQDKELFFINFDRLGDKAPTSLYSLLVLGWLTLVGKNFYAFTLVSSGITDFLNQERVIGSYQFSIKGLFLFLIILLISMLISKLLSVFSTDPEASLTQDQRKRVSFGSWLLLVRIFVISCGLFLAFAASGIPLDKITIILGALSVGIGLGLQGLVNNLVSGLIIAFENTLKVGDLIEIEGKPGIMKSIGFRSSVVNMFEGSTEVIPNGDLISKQLTNWTTGKGRKLSIVIGVAYGTDLEKALRLLREIVGQDSRIRLNPAPRVVPLEFADSSIDIDVTFWVNSYFDYPFVKGDVISLVDQAFKANDVRIPFPQRDLYIKSIPTDNPTSPNSPKGKE